MSKGQRIYVTVAGAAKVYSGINWQDAIDAVWAHLVGYGRVYIKQKDEVGRMRSLEVKLRSDEKILFTPESTKDDVWAREVEARVLRGPQSPREARTA